MKKLIFVSVVLGVGLFVIPAMAGDKATTDPQPVAFQAFSNLPVLEQAALTPKTDTELASVEGTSFRRSFQDNFASVFQGNFGGRFQSNTAFVDQVNSGWARRQSNFAGVSQVNSN